MFTADDKTWAHRTFGSAHLGDCRRAARLVEYAAAQARSAKASTLRACRGDTAAAEGAYRFIESKLLETEDIAAAGYEATARMLPAVGDLLAIQDTTALTFAARLSPELGPVGAVETTGKTKGMFCHSTLLLGAETGETLGLIDQHWWVRLAGVRASDTKKTRAYEDKESFKWQQADQAARKRLGADWARVITVGDRETDITAYLSWKVAQGDRFVLRALHDRAVEGEDKRLRAAVAKAPVLGTLAVEVAQRGGEHGRVKRTALLEVRGITVKLAPDDGKKAERPTVGAVWATERHPPEGCEALDWLLYTSEPTASAQEAIRALNIYGKRWRIEDFHKAWKSGCGVEDRRMQSEDTLWRVAVILAFVAVRLVQLRDERDLQDEPCDRVLTTMQWKMLWVSTEKRKPIPAVAPTRQWACHAIGRMGGWLPRKGTRPGWQALWEGWARLEERIEGLRLAQEMMGGQM